MEICTTAEKDLVRRKIMVKSVEQIIYENCHKDLDLNKLHGLVYTEGDGFDYAALVKYVQNMDGITITQFNEIKVDNIKHLKSKVEGIKTDEQNVEELDAENEKHRKSFGFGGLKKKIKGKIRSEDVVEEKRVEKAEKDNMDNSELGTGVSEDIAEKVKTKDEELGDPEDEPLESVDTGDDDGEQK